MRAPLMKPVHASSVHARDALNRRAVACAEVTNARRRALARDFVHHERGGARLLVANRHRGALAAVVAGFGFGVNGCRRRGRHGRHGSRDDGRRS